MLAGRQLLPAQKSRHTRLLAMLKEMHDCPTSHLFGKRIVRCTSFPPTSNYHENRIHTIPYLSTAMDRIDHGNQTRTDVVKTAYYSSDTVPRTFVLDINDHHKMETYHVSISLSGNGMVAWREKGKTISAMGCFPLSQELTKKIVAAERKDLWKRFDDMGGWEMQRTECSFDFTGNMETMLYGIGGSLEETAMATRRLFPRPMLVPPIYPFSVPIELSTGCTKKKACRMCSLKDVQGHPLTTRSIKDRITEWSKSIGRLVTSTQSVFFGRNCLPPPGLVFDVLEFLKSDRIIENIVSGVPEQMRDYVHMKREHWGNIGHFSAFGRVPDVLAYAPGVLEEMRSNGITKLFLSLETGSDRIRRYVLGKDYSASDLETAIKKLFDAGIEAGVIVMLGVGGRKDRDEHLSETLVAMTRLQTIEEGYGQYKYVHPLQFLVSPIELDHSTEALRRRIGEITQAEILSELSELGIFEEKRFIATHTNLHLGLQFTLTTGKSVILFPYNYPTLFV